jgi:replication factor A1
MTINNLTVHIEDILNALSKDSEEVSQDVIKKELKKFLEYGVPIEQAKQTLITKFGGNASFNSFPTSSERTMISNLQPNERSVNILCQVIAISPKEITVKGENKKIFYGIIGDESGTIPFTAWNDIEIEKGDVIEVSNAYTREWQGNVQLNFGDRVNIEKTDRNKLPKDAFKPKKFNIKDLKSGIGAVDIKVMILDLKEREVKVNGETKKVFSGTIGDETGKAQFTSWYDFKLKVGETLQITGGYIKSWKGIPQLTFDENAKVKKLDKEKISKDEVKIRKMQLHELVDERGALDVNVEGTIIEIRPGSGFIIRCPECNRTLQNGECSIHGDLKGKPDLRIKFIVDDGSAAISGIMNKEITEKIIGKTLEECKKMEENTLLGEINNLLFAHKIKLKGNALGDSFGTTLIVNDVEFVDVDIKEETAKLSKELEELE